MSTNTYDTDHTPGAKRRVDGPLLRPEQAAELLNVKTSWVYDAVRRETCRACGSAGTSGSPGR